VFLKVIPHVKDWWKTYCEHKEIEETSLFTVIVTRVSFRDNIKEQCYHVVSYGDLYTKCTTLQHKRDQAVLEFTNIFHTLRTNMGIKYSERNLVLMYHDGLHRYIQAEMEFLDISSLSAAYRYVIKIEQKIKQNTQKFGLGNPS
jgi:hypothetical protein